MDFAIGALKVAKETVVQRCRKDKELLEQLTKFGVKITAREIGATHVKLLSRLRSGKLLKRAPKVLLKRAPKVLLKRAPIVLSKRAPKVLLKRAPKVLLKQLQQWAPEVSSKQLQTLWVLYQT